MSTVDSHTYTPTGTIANPRAVDERGRVAPEHMSEQELLVETVTTLRTVSDALEKFSASMADSPMLKMLGL